jgi:hypothetical protein
MENKAIEQAVDFFLAVIDNSKFEALYNEFMIGDESDEYIREFIKMRLINRNN